MIHAILIGAALILLPPPASARTEMVPVPSPNPLESLAAERASFACTQLLTDQAHAEVAVAARKAAERERRRQRAAERRAEKAAAREAALAATPIDANVDRINVGEEKSIVDPLGRATGGDDFIRDIAVPRHQICRLLRPTNDRMAGLIVERFRSLVDKHFRRAPVEATVLVGNVHDATITAEARRQIRFVSERLDALANDAHGPADKYLVRRVRRGRRVISAYLEQLAARAAFLQHTVFLTGSPDAKPYVPGAAPKVAPEAEAAPTPDLVYFPPLNLTIPGLTTREAGLTWKALGWGAVTAGAFVTLFLPDPKIVTPLFLTTAGGLSMLSASVRNEVSGWVAHVRTLWEQRREQKAIETAAEILRQRHERNLVQIQTLREMSERLAGNQKEQGLAYYSYLADVSRDLRLDGLVDLTGFNPGTTRLVRVEHIIYSDSRAHYLITVVSDAETGAPLFSKFSI